jgi:hypothetical protein
MKFGIPRRKPKPEQEETLWKVEEKQPEPEPEPSGWTEHDGRKELEEATFAPKKQSRKLSIQFPKIHLPRPRLSKRVAKVKRGVAFGFGLLYLLSGVASFPSPIMLVGFISSYFMFEYVWVTRKLSWLNEGHGL